MKTQNAVPSRFVLPLPGFLLHPITALVIACVHVYLSAGHLVNLFSGDVQWTHVWKGFGALGGAYVFAALASRGLIRRKEQQLQTARDWARPTAEFGLSRELGGDAAFEMLQRDPTARWARTFGMTPFKTSALGYVRRTKTSRAISGREFRFPLFHTER